MILAEAAFKRTRVVADHRVSKMPSLEFASPGDGMIGTHWLPMKRFEVGSDRIVSFLVNGEKHLNSRQVPNAPLEILPITFQMKCRVETANDEVVTCGRIDVNKSGNVFRIAVKISSEQIAVPIPGIVMHTRRVH